MWYNFNRNMMYETVLIVKPQLSDEEVAKTLEAVKAVIVKETGEILAEDKWGRRKLAYAINREREGFYAYLKFRAPSTILQSLNHHFRVTDDVMRHLTVSVVDKPSKPKKTKKKPAAPAAVSAS